MDSQFPSYLTRYGEDPTTYGVAQPSETRPGKISGTLYLIEGQGYDPETGEMILAYTIGCDHTPLQPDGAHLLDGVLFDRAGALMGMIEGANYGSDDGDGDSDMN